MFYEVEMLDTKTGKRHRFQMDRSIGWADGPRGAIWGWQNRVCDCNLHPYFAALAAYETAVAAAEAKGQTIAYKLYPDGEGKGGLVNTPNWRGNYPLPCDHSMPPKRYAALTAHLTDGRVIDLKTGATIQNARAA